MGYRTDVVKRCLLSTLVGLSCVALTACRTSAPSASVSGLDGGWGIDAVLTGHVEAARRPAYLSLVRESGVGWLRERGPETALGELRAAGFRTVSFTGLRGVAAERRENQLPEDLLAVYHAAVAMAREHPGVDAWEMVGEPDVGYARDLPDRVVAFQKAVYLGVQAAVRSLGRAEEGATAGSDDRSRSAGNPTPGPPAHPITPPFSRAPLVLMGALALPPGPWLDRAVRNGLLDYTDAYNFHFYGHAADLGGVIAAHRALIKSWAIGGRSAGRGTDTGGQIALDQNGRGSEDPTIALSAMRQARGTAGAALPMWITEAGINAVDPDDFLNPARRQLQAEFTVSTARQALADPDVAMFMPFILVHEGDPHAMTAAGPTATGTSAAPAPIARFPAWEAYAKFTQQHPWPDRPLARPAHEPNPVVVQWLPDPATSTTHKVSGTYRFRNNTPMRAEIRIYNLGATTVRGRLTAAAPGWVRVEGLTSLDDGRLGSPEIEIPALGRVVVPLSILPTASQYFREDWEPTFVESDGRVSPVLLAFERDPADQDFRAEPLPLRTLAGGRIQFPAFPAYRAGETFGVWTTMNGLRVGEVEVPDGGTAARFQTDKVENDPLEPPMAVARLDGLPEDGFLRLHLDRPMDRNTQVRVDLVDDAGQRFCIWENFGRNYSRMWEDVWLNLRDFGMFFWGRATSQPMFRPARVREIQLRFYFAQANDPIELGLELMRPR